MSKSKVLLFAGLVCFGVCAAGQANWRADLNGDTFVDFGDFAALAANWRQSSGGLIGDLDNSGSVDEIDLIRLVHYWLTEFECERADFDYDGIVDFHDFAILADAWLSGAGEANWRRDCDFDFDDFIGISDLSRFTNQWLKEYPANVIYVNAGAAPSGDGTSWENAFAYLQDAIAVASEGYQIWVAEGVYRPDANSDIPGGTGLRTSTFELPEGVAVYGGFPPGGCWEYREPEMYETILSGDIGIEGNENDNCYNVVVGANDVTIDGFVIADGNADSTGDRARGAGMRNEDVNNLTIANCTFANNYARYDGGAIYNYESELVVIDCVFINNKSGDDGGGVYSSNADGSFTNCTFSDNQAYNRGGGMYNYQSGFEVINCLFGGNHADANGGAVFNGYKAVKLINCTVACNSATNSGGGIYNTYSSSTITNCIVWDNGQAIYNKSCEPHISYCDIEDSGGSGAGWNTSFGLDEGNNIDIEPNLNDILALQTGSHCIDAGKNFAVPRDVITDIKGNARFNGPVDMGAYEYGQLDMSADSDGDGLPDWWEYRYGLNPNDMNDAQGDLDEDGLTNFGEYENNCDVIFFDTDGDLLSDGWEVLYGFNPLTSDVVEVVDSNNVYVDADGDGLDALQEVVFATSPINADSDGDGVSDGIEVAQGSLPMDATDYGLPPGPDQICELKLTVGDWSSSQSERYDLIVGPVTHQATQFGVVKTSNYNQFRPGNRYEVRIVHRGTSPDRLWYPQADYDYIAQIESVSLPAGVVMQIDDADGILGVHGEPNTPTEIFDAEGKTAYVNLIKVNFLEYIYQTYGWDNFSTTVPWKSVKVGDTDRCIAQIGPAEKASDIFFRSLQPSYVNVSPVQASGSPQTVTLTGAAEGEADVWSRLDSVDGTNMSQLSVAAYQQDEYTLAIRVVNEQDDDVQVIPVGQGKPYQTAITAGADANLTTTPSGDDTIAGPTITTGADGICNTTADVNDVQVIPLNQGKPNEICVSAGANGFRDTPDSAIGGDDQLSGDNITTGADGVCNTTADNTDDISTDPYTDAALQNYLNSTVYNQAIVRWTNVEKLPAMTVNFDLDRDGFIDVDTWMSAEMQVIRNQCDDPNYTHMIFVVNNPSDGSAGFMDFGQKWGFIHPGTGCADMLQVTGHELGHGMGGLTHTPLDLENLMYNYCGSGRNKLRKQQWHDTQLKQGPTP